MEITTTHGTMTGNWLLIEFDNNETGVTFFVSPPQIQGNYCNSWRARTSGGYCEFFDNGDDLIRYMNDNNFTRSN